MTEKIQNRTGDDLFDFFRTEKDPADNAAPEKTLAGESDGEIPEPAPAPETLPLIREEPAETKPSASEETPREEKSRKAPVIFSGASPGPAVQEEAGAGFSARTARSAGFLQEKREFVPLQENALDSSATIGRILRLGREASGYTLEEASRRTHVALNYLLALEEDDAASLPPPVYVSAYLRALCGLYRLSPGISKHVRELQRKNLTGNDLSDALLRRLGSDSMVNEEEEKRVSRIFTAGIIVTGIAILTGIWAIVLAVLNAASANGDPEEGSGGNAPEIKSAPPSAVIPFDTEKFNDLTPEPVCNLHVLKMNSEPAVRRN